MDVLYLIPSSSSSLALAALDLPENREHVRLESVRLPHSPSPYPELHRCICISVSTIAVQSGAWSFTLASFRGADIYLPVPSDHGPICVGFGYTVTLEDEFDEPGLMLRDCGGPGSCAVTVHDPMIAEQRQQWMGEQIVSDTRYLRLPDALNMGQYSFSVCQPQVTRGDLLRARLDLARRISAQTPIDDHETEWRPTGTKLGEGSSGVVSLVRGMRLGALRACKTIQVKTHRELQALKREIRVMKSLFHPNILRCCDVLNLPERRMETAFLPIVKLILQPCHGSLQNLIDDPNRIAASYFGILAKQTTAALAYMHNHEKQVLHRDLKPANILFRIADLGESAFDQQPLEIIATNPNIALHFYLADFGHSRVAGPICETKCGSPIYMAPELWAPRRAYTAAVDIYALGATFMDVWDRPSMLALHGFARNDAPPEMYRYQLALQSFVRRQANTHPVWQWMRAMVSWSASERPTAQRISEVFEDIAGLGQASRQDVRTLTMVDEMDADGTDVDICGRIRAVQNYNDPVVPACQPMPVPVRLTAAYGRPTGHRGFLRNHAYAINAAGPLPRTLFGQTPLQPFSKRKLNIDPTLGAPRHWTREEAMRKIGPLRPDVAAEKSSAEPKEQHETALTNAITAAAAEPTAAIATVRDLMNANISNNPAIPGTFIISFATDPAASVPAPTHVRPSNLATASGYDCDDQPDPSSDTIHPAQGAAAAGYDKSSSSRLTSSRRHAAVNQESSARRTRARRHGALPASGTHRLTASTSDRPYASNSNRLTASGRRIKKKDKNRMLRVARAAGFVVKKGLVWAVKAFGQALTAGAAALEDKPDECNVTKAMPAAAERQMVPAAPARQQRAKDVVDPPTSGEKRGLSHSIPTDDGERAGKRVKKEPAQGMDGKGGMGASCSLLDVPGRYYE